MKSRTRSARQPKPKLRTKKPATVRGRGSIKDCATLGSTPQTEIVDGHLFRWVGIGWVDEGEVDEIYEEVMCGPRTKR